MKSVIGMTMATVGLFAMTSGAGHAGVTIEIKDNGSDILVTASGTLNMTALTESIASLAASGPGISDFGSDIRSSQALVLGEPTVLSYTLRWGPSFDGPDYPFFGAERAAQTQLFFSDASGDLISVGYSGSSMRVGIGVSNSYMDDAPLSASAKWSGVDLARLGVAAGDSFTWNWGTGDTSDFLTINVTAVPEPSSYALMLAGLGLVGLAARRAAGRSR